MLATGELIRSMNYVEDITNTLRRICIYIPNMNTEERQRLAAGAVRAVDVERPAGRVQGEVAGRLAVALDQLAELLRELVAV